MKLLKKYCRTNRQTLLNAFQLSMSGLDLEAKWTEITSLLFKPFSVPYEGA
jgi:hypothetical protein